MTVFTPISADGATEACVHVSGTTPMLQRFAAVQTALASYLHAERDLEHSGAWDPACDHWLRDAEEARSTLATALEAVCASEVLQPQDRPLQQLARIARVMLLATDEVEFARTYGLIGQFDTILRCHGHDEIDQRVNLMLAEAKAQLAAIAALPDYELEVGDDYDELAPASAIGPQNDAPRQIWARPLPHPVDVGDIPPTQGLPGAAAA